jgi:L-alanine-DL-glutamate epimerase-like enolase superfamily enzyme
VIHDLLEPRLVGEDPLNIERLWSAMYEPTHEYGRPDRRGAVAAIGAVDVALWDLMGKALGQPVYRLLGGFTERVPAYADAGYLQPSWEGFYEEMEAVETGLEQGYDHIKVHILRDDVDVVAEKVRRVREMLGPHRELMLDLCRVWEPWASVELARRCEEYDIYWLEEPSLWDDQIGDLAFVAGSTSIPVAAGEAECTLFACRDLMALAGVKFMQADTVNAGGFTQMRKIAAIAQAYHGLVSPHGASYPEICSQLIAGIPNGSVVSVFPAGHPTEIWSRLYREPVALSDGWLELSERLGLGLELDRGFVERHRL